MATRLSKVRSDLPAFKVALDTFNSKHTFKLVHMVNPPDTPTASDASTSDVKTLFILDSSYNPPSRAHLALACAVSCGFGSLPHRLLLLFSTHNADKSPKPASFEQRLAMMILFAEDLQDFWKAEPLRAVPIDIGLTSKPYYTDKSMAIVGADPQVYPSQPSHVHLLGYDTLTRCLDPKYYQKFDPPLHALKPYFDAGHSFICLLRPNSSSDNAVSADTEAEQRAYITRLSSGSELEKYGFQREWGSQIGFLDGDDVPSAVGISSTAIRTAAKEQDWDAVSHMCTPRVAAWIREEGLYVGTA
ncbi:Nucleotidylyl transferase [Trichodelitschia bisporula]|uniref:Nucleotidylyl transferase n=1 Tax=Trichodelitschia bisporula TaxID=703511 RepID=A0A6G1HT56_9PEZI|nr:Nucleotidylyl transferase [Trichodelitschia bisporula]